MFDSLRWEGFSSRPGDIIISTPPKCGTTWMQMICALLIFQRTTFDRSLDLISPWLDMQTRELDEVLAGLDAQQHRRFIKTHTPLDGLPYEPEVTYICVGRDPRDVAISWGNHQENSDFDAFLRARERVVGLDDLAEIYRDSTPPVVPGDDALGRFWNWVDETTPPERTGRNLAQTMHHLVTFWEVRTRPNVVLVHYSALQRDLDGEMRRIAERLDIPVVEESFADLVAAARFDAMRERADTLVPDSTSEIWRDNGQFFHAGQNGQWQALLDDEGRQRYAARVAHLGPRELIDWVHDGPLDLPAAT